MCWSCATCCSVDVVAMTSHGYNVICCGGMYVLVMCHVLLC